jgi:G3E family GTPase
LQQPVDLDKFKQWVEVLLWTQDGAAPDLQQGKSPSTDHNSSSSKKSSHDTQGRPHNQQQQQPQLASSPGAPQPGSVSAAAGAPEASTSGPDLDVLRMKGLVWVKEDPRVHLLQVS